MIWFILNTLIFVGIVSYLVLVLFEKVPLRWHIALLAPAFIAFVLSWQFVYNDEFVKPKYGHYNLPLKADLVGCYIHATMPPNMAFPDKLELGWYDCWAYDDYVKNYR